MMPVNYDLRTCGVRTATVSEQLEVTRLVVFLRAIPIYFDGGSPTRCIAILVTSGRTTTLEQRNTLEMNCNVFTLVQNCFYY